MERVVPLDECGLPLKASGETDFPCMSGTRVGQGRSYVQLGKPARVDYAQWVDGLARGRSYVSDGYAHALEFSVDGRSSGRRAAARRARQGRRQSHGRVFARDAARARLRRRRSPSAAGATSATRSSNASRSMPDPLYERGQRLVEVVVNGRVAGEPRSAGRRPRAHARVLGRRSSAAAGWRCGSFRSCTRTPCTCLVGGKPIRASRDSAQWALACIDQLWRARSRRIADGERAEAEKAYEQARAYYRRAISESSGTR